MSFKLWPADATSIGEKIVYTAGTIIAPLLWLFMQFSALGVFKNMYQASVKAAGFGWHAAGLVLSAFSVLFLVGTSRDANYVTKSDTANGTIIFLSVVLSLLAYAGFSFNG